MVGFSSSIKLESINMILGQYNSPTWSKFQKALDKKYTSDFEFSRQQQLMNEGMNFSFFAKGLIALMKTKKSDVYLVYYNNPPEEYTEFAPVKEVVDDDI